MVALTRVLLALLLTGCATARVYPEKPGQRLAVATVWNAYGLDDGATRAPPAIRWIEGAALNCRGKISGAAGFLDGGICTAGVFDPKRWVAHVGWPEGQPLWETGLAHELCHAYLHLRRNLRDPYHQAAECWAPGGLVARAQERLRLIGGGP